jgi:predicted GNAT family acetyltransferase
VVAARDTPRVADITDNTREHRFETMVDGRLAELTYRIDGDRLVLLHTGVPDELGGRGLAAELVQAATRRAVDDDLTIVPMCSYARSWLEKHPDQTGGASIDWSTPH